MALSHVREVAQPGAVGFSCSDRLTAMKLRFSANGTFTQTESRMLVCDDGRPDAPSTDVTNGSYEVSGETLVLTEDFGDGFVARSTGRFSGADLTIYHRELWQNGLRKTTTDSPLIFASS